jgi:hypothetical protein
MSQEPCHLIYLLSILSVSVLENLLGVNRISNFIEQSFLEQLVVILMVKKFPTFIAGDLTVCCHVDSSQS